MRLIDAIIIWWCMGLSDSFSWRRLQKKFGRIIGYLCETQKLFVQTIRLIRAIGRAVLLLGVSIYTVTAMIRLVHSIGVIFSPRSIAVIIQVGWRVDRPRNIEAISLLHHLEWINLLAIYYLFDLIRPLVTAEKKVLCS